MKSYSLRCTVLTACALSFASAAQAESEIDSRFNQLEQRVASLQQQLTEARVELPQLNGFFSTGYLKASTDAGYAGATDDASLRAESLAGLQATFALTERTKGIIQVVSRGADNWDTRLEWGYLSYHAANNFFVRVGRMQLPLFLYSETQNIGYTQTWIRPPEALYGAVPVTGYTGGELAHTLHFRNSALTNRFFSGISDENREVGNNAAEVEFRNIAGLTTEWTNYRWTLRTVVATTETTIESPDLLNPGATRMIADDDRTWFYGAGVKYDNGRFQMASEYARIEVDSLYPNTDSAYLMLGYRLWDVTPYMGFGWTESKRDAIRRNDPQLNALSTRRNEYSLGLRWDINAGVALKADWTYADKFFEKPGFALDAREIATQRIRDTDVFTIRLDAAL
ncbi:MAG: hypothetical protein LAT63_05365 [Marinobacter sp.]|nr:hypothetical protein [Marinobacter sp.]